jgi:hypothetical protein
MSRDFLFLAGPLSPDDIKQQVAREYGLDVGDFEGKCRRPEVVEAKWEAIARVHEAFRQMSLPAIGRVFSMDHTTILHALRKLKAGRYAEGQARIVMEPSMRRKPVIPDRGEVRRLYLKEGLTIDETARRMGCQRSSVLACITPAEIEAMKRARYLAASANPVPRTDPLDHPSRVEGSIRHLVDFKRAGHTAAWYRANCEISELEDARERRRLGMQPRVIVQSQDERSFGGSPAGLCAV